MDRKRRIALVVAILSIGLGAGQFVQSRSAKTQTAQIKAPVMTPTKVVPVSAGPEESVPILGAAPALPPSATAITLPIAADPVRNPATAPRDSATAAVTGACSTTLDLVAQPSAMIGLTLLAPCHASERVVLKHAGLAVTAKTSVTGSIFLDIPALEATSKVVVLFSNGETAEAEIALPEAAALGRFAVQWTADDAFQLHAFENGADYGQPGDVSAVTPNTSLGALPRDTGFLTVLGDATVDLPMMAEVYTYPTKPTKVDVIVEAAVSEATCGRELLGETLTSMGGEVFITDLTVAMPDCEAAGDILVLKNLVPEMKLAAN